jgi:competence protein ComEC
VLALALAAGWLAGLYIASRAGLTPWVFVACAFLGGIGALLAHRRRSAWRLVALAAIACGLGGLRFAPPTPGPGDVAQWHGVERLGVRGTVRDEPRRSTWSLLVRLSVDEVRPGAEWQAAEGKVEVTLPRGAVVQLGDRLEVWGRLEVPPSSERFDYASYLARQGVFSVLRYPERYRYLAPAEGGVSPLAHARERLARTLGRLLPQPHAGIAEGLLLGRRSGLTEEVRLAFQRSGMTHLLVVSGFNVMLVAGVALWLAERRLRRPRSVVPALLAMLVYAAIVGFDPPVLRAALMGTLALVALAFGRPGDALNGLALAAVVMTALDPQALFDLSFQLSCVATAGLVLLAPSIERQLACLPEWLRAGLATTAAAQIATAPVLALNFGRLQLVGLPANALALPAVPLATISAGAATLAGLVWEPLGHLIALVPWGAIGWLLWGAERFGALPWAEVEVPGVDAAWAWPYYGLLLLASAPQMGLPGLNVLWQRGRAWLAGRRRLAVAGAATLLVLLGAGAMLGTSASAPAAHFLDVGEGDATLVVGPDGAHVLIDAGPPGADAVAAVGRRLPFLRRSVDLVILTDTDSEHLGGLPELAERYDVRLAIEPAQVRPSALYRRWREVVEQRGIPVRTAAAGMRVAWPGLDVEIIDPGALAPDGRLSRAVVVHVRLAGQPLLIAGDAPAEQQQALATRTELAGSVLRVPRRGAANALDPTVLAGIRPAAAVISAGRNNRWGHPHPQVLDLLAAAGVPVLRTDRHGTVTLVPEAGAWRVATTRQAPD